MDSCLYEAKDIIGLASRIGGSLFVYADNTSNNRDFVEVTNYDILNDENTKYVFLALRQDLPWGLDAVGARIVSSFCRHEKNYFTIHTIWGNVVAEVGDLSSCKIRLSFSGGCRDYSPGCPGCLDFKWRSMAEFEKYLHGIEEQVLKLHQKLKLKALKERKNAIRGAMDEYDR